MKRFCAPLVAALLICSCFLSAPAQASAAGPDDTAGVSYIIDKLREKMIITADEAASLQRSGSEGGGSDLQALIELLKEKDVLSSEELSALKARPVAAPRQPAKVLLPSQDREFIRLLKERWVKNKNRGADFDELAAEHSDPADLIGRLRVMGALSAAEADELDRIYRDNYMSGAVSSVMEGKEKEYLERIRKSVAWELDEKIQGRFKEHWTQNVKLSGDFRLRYQGEFFDENNAVIGRIDRPGEVANSTIDRHLVRIRARLGVDAKASEDFAVGLGLATGSTSNPVSTNQTLGDFFNKKTITLDKAFLKWSPAPSFTAWGGRHPNPWFYSDLVWDPDVNFDGVTVQYRPQLSDAWSMFFSAGAYPLQEVELSQHDKWLFGGQLGVQYKRFNRWSAKAALGFYDYENTVGIPNSEVGDTTNDFTAPQFQQKGNTLMAISRDTSGAPTKFAYASEFKELNLTGSLDIGIWDPVHVVLLVDYVNNLGFDKQEVDARASTGLPVPADVKKMTTGYQLALTLGYPKIQESGDWSASLAYKYLESDAVMDAFTDSDFHLGGTDAKGWVFGVEYGVARNVWLSTRWLTANEINGPPLAIDVFQFNVNAKF